MPAADEHRASPTSRTAEAPSADSTAARDEAQPDEHQRTSRSPRDADHRPVRGTADRAAAAPAPVHRTGLRGALSRTPGTPARRGRRRRARRRRGRRDRPERRPRAVAGAGRRRRRHHPARRHPGRPQRPGGRRRDRDQRVPRRRPGAARAARPVRRGRRVGRERARAAGRVQRGRRRAAGPGDRRADHVHRARRAGPRQQPAGLPGRRGVPRPGVDGPAHATCCRSSTSWCRPTATGWTRRSTPSASVPWLLALGILALAALVVVQVWLARRTHRRLNAGLFWSTVLALAASVGGAVVLGSAARAARRRRATARTTRRSRCPRRTRWPTTRSRMESFTLIKRGSGAAYEEQFVAETDEARDAAGAGHGRPGAGRRCSTTGSARTRRSGRSTTAATGTARSRWRSATSPAPRTTCSRRSRPRRPAAWRPAPRRRTTRLSGSGGSSVLVGWLMLVAGAAGGGPVLARHLDPSGGVPVTTTTTHAAWRAARWSRRSLLLAGCAGAPAAAPAAQQQSDAVARRPPRVPGRGGVRRRHRARRRRTPRAGRRGADRGRHPGPRRAARRRLGRHPADGLAQPAVRPDRGLRHRHAARGLGRDLRRPRPPAVPRHHLGPAARRAGEPRGRPGGPHVHHELRALGDHRVLRRVPARAGQKVLVTRDSDGDRASRTWTGKRVCAPEGTTTLERLQETYPGVEAVSAPTHTGCLVLFQQGKVDAITGDDTILAGFVAQDPYAKVVGERVQRRAVRHRRRRGPGRTWCGSSTACSTR